MLHSLVPPHKQARLSHPGKAKRDHEPQIGEFLLPSDENTQICSIMLSDVKLDVILDIKYIHMHLLGT